MHGIGQDKWNSLKYGDVFLDQGYNILVYDSRNHGETGGDNPTKMVYDLFNKKKAGIKALYIAKDAGHAESLKVDKARYEEEEINFLNLVFKNGPGN